MTVGSAWLVVTKGPAEVSLPIYILIIFLFVLCLLLFAAICILVCNILEKSEQCIEVRSFRVASDYGKHRSRYNKAKKLEMGTVRSLKVRYGKFEYICKDFMVDYVWNIAMRTVDAIFVTEY